jgi:hypothetical protein
MKRDNIYIWLVFCIAHTGLMHGMFVNTARTVGRQTRSAGRTAIMHQAQQQQQLQQYAQRAYGSGGQADEEGKGGNWWFQFWHGTAPTVQSSEIPKKQKNYSKYDVNSNTGESKSSNKNNENTGSSGRSHRFEESLFMSVAVRAEYDKLLKALKLPPNTLVDDMKKRFNEVSMENHPDMVASLVNMQRISNEAGQRRMAYYNVVTSAYADYKNAQRAERKAAELERKKTQWRESAFE